MNKLDIKHHLEDHYGLFIMREHKVNVSINQIIDIFVSEICGFPCKRFLGSDQFTFGHHY